MFGEEKQRDPGGNNACVGQLTRKCFLRRGDSMHPRPSPVTVPMPDGQPYIVKQLLSAGGWHWWLVHQCHLDRGESR
jgi:hypothetical protein